MAEEAVEILPIDSVYFGHTAVEWSMKWWDWLLSIPKDKNPAYDLIGENSGINQRFHEVFFLCQTFGNSTTQISRKTEIPRKRVLFMPIINWISISGVDGDTFAQLRLVAKKKIDSVSSLELKVNGMSMQGLNRHRIISPLFRIELPKDNILGLASGSRQCMSDGYWIFLKPKTRTLTVSSFGMCSSGVNRIGVRYELEIS